MLANPLSLPQNAGMLVDPFSDVLTLINAQSVVTGGFSAGGSWGIRFQPPAKLKFFGVVRGGCWLTIEGAGEPVRVESGDVFMLSPHRGFTLASDLGTELQEAREVFADSYLSAVGEGDETFLVGGHIRIDDAGGRYLLETLPPHVHVRADTPQAANSQWLLDQLTHERIAGLPGASVASSQIAQLMFVQILRAYLSSSGELAPGRLRAVSDPRLSPALRLMHGEPARNWRLEELARAAAMSRTTFALHFKTAAGMAPLAYLAEWRMQLAQRALREDGASVSTLARTLGYGSESAFSNAFKRIVGVSPAHYRRTRAGQQTG